MRFGDFWQAKTLSQLFKLIEGFGFYLVAGGTQPPMPTFIDGTDLAAFKENTHHTFR